VEVEPKKKGTKCEKGWCRNMIKIKGDENEEVIVSKEAVGKGFVLRRQLWQLSHCTQMLSTTLRIFQKAKFRPDDAERLVYSDNSMIARYNDEYRCKFMGLPRPASTLKDDQWRRCNIDLKLGFYCIPTAVASIPRVHLHSLALDFRICRDRSNQ